MICLHFLNFDFSIITFSSLGHKKFYISLIFNCRKFSQFKNILKFIVPIYYKAINKLLEPKKHFY